jgi:hypothetical protein
MAMAPPDHTLWTSTMASPANTGRVGHGDLPDPDQDRDPLAQNGCGDSLDAVATYLKAHDSAEAAISGFHDASGSQGQNQELAKGRALSSRYSQVTVQS